jgi:GNAT superfamily N-acetyltransferase
MEFVDLRDRRDESLLRAVHDGLYVGSFPIEEEREDLEYWRSSLWGDGEDGRGPSVHALVAGTKLDQPQERRIAGLAFVELYLASGVGLLSYLAVDADFRRAGLGRQLVSRGLEALRQDAVRRGSALNAVFAEVHDPDAAEERLPAEVMDPTERVSFFAKLGARRIPIPYVQPALAEGRDRARSLQLVALPGEGRDRTLPSSLVRDFLAELYELSEGNRAPADGEFRAMTEALEADSIQLSPLNAVEESPAIRVQRYGVAFEYVTHGSHLVELPDAAEQFASFEDDVVAYAFQQRTPFTSKPIHVPDPCRQIEIEFAPEFRFVSEGRTCALVAEDGAVEPRRVEVQVRASRTRFRSGVTVWHLVLTPRVGSSRSELNEYDVIKLAKHWAGGENIAGPYAGSGAETAVRFVRGEQRWSLRQLAADVFPEEFRTARLRAGIIQLITGDEDPTEWCEAWEAIRAGKEETAVDTTFPFKHDEQRVLVESIAGIIQTLIDFREIDDAELRDVLAGMQVGQDGLQGVHKGTLLYMAASDRTWDVGKLSYGISPYLLLPHALLLHNEEILHAAAKAVREEREAARQLTEARNKFAQLPGRNTVGRLLRMPVHALTRARLVALRVREERRKLRDVRESLRGALQRDFLPNIFHYPNERRIYEVGERSRGLAALEQELRETLDEFDARWEGGSSMRRTMADDIKAGLLFAIAGFALKDYLTPVALVLIFGLGGLIYVGFRFYTWR